MHFPMCCARYACPARFFSTFSACAPGWRKRPKESWSSMPCFPAPTISSPITSSWKAAAGPRSKVRSPSNYRGRHHRAAARRHARAGDHARHARTPEMSMYRLPTSGELPVKISVGTEGGEAGALRVRFPRVRLTALQPFADSAAARHPHAQSRQWRARSLFPRGARRVQGPHGRRMHAEPHQRTHVRRRDPALSGNTAGGSHQLARRPARPLRGSRIDGTAREPGARLDARSAGAGGRAVALGVRREIHASSSATRPCST